MSKEKNTTHPLPTRLREAREKTGISQMNLGIEAGIDPSAASARVNQYEQGKHTPDFQTAARLASVLGIPVTYLYSEKEREAELILSFAKLSAKEQSDFLNELKNR